MINEADFFNEEASSFFKQGDFEKAIESFSKAIQINPKISKYFFNRGNAYRKIRKIEESISDAQEAIELDESNIKAHNLMGRFMRIKLTRSCKRQERQKEG